jgi:prepilin-type N-terminal cleavage/methylation domain-containing protein
MKTPILLKLLQSSATKANPNYTNNASRKSDAGFTILELLVVVIMLGVLSAIAAPGWLGFINRQRVRTVNDRVFQSLRLAQSEAKRNKRDVKITFNYDRTATPAIDPPTVTFDPPLATGGSTQTLNAGGEVKPGTIALTFNKPDSTDPKKSSLIFDYQGKPDKTSFIVTVAPVGGGAKQCAIVETIIGGMRTGEGSECP